TRGVAILIHKTVAFYCISHISDQSGHFVIVHGRVGRKLVTYTSVYAPSVNGPSVVRSFVLLLAQFPSPWIIRGDFNCPLDTSMDRSSPSSRTLLSYMVDYGLIDGWWHSHPTSRVLIPSYSFYLYAHQTFSRIDFVLVSSLLLTCDLLPCYISDHSPILIQMQLLEGFSAPVRWRLNSYLLSRDDFIMELRSVIIEFFQFNKATPPDLAWEALKATIRGTIIAYSTAYKKSLQKQMSDLEIELRRAETDQYKTNSSEAGERVALLHHRLTALSSSKVEQVLLWVKSRYYARGDKVGKLLAWQLWKEEVERLIPTIRVSDTST
uniref:Endonuclease/exonuclease/phosphatase domain-containing protein n=1 Tax=Latimeria chalumnae TaxID=7897 RepID=H3A3D1_LATCH